MLLRKHKAVFEKGYGVTRGFKATVHLKQTGRPVFKKVHPAPFALRGAISAELVRVEAHNIVTEVDRSDWATPTVNIHKSDRSVRICGDYKVTVNPLVDADHYSLPTVLLRIFCNIGWGVDSLVNWIFPMHTVSWSWMISSRTF